MGNICGVGVYIDLGGWILLQFRLHLPRTPDCLLDYTCRGEKVLCGYCHPAQCIWGVGRVVGHHRNSSTNSMGKPPKEVMLS